MAKGIRNSIQHYPRIDDESDNFNSFLNENELNPHSYRINESKLKDIIRKAMEYANRKSSRAILNIPLKTKTEDIDRIYNKQGQELFKYFVKYCGDPASTAHDCFQKHFSIVASEQFRNRTLQKERMNSGWRYQFIAKEAANQSKRFLSVSDIGNAEADFNASIITRDSKQQVNIYLSVKNRTNTMGGQDWPKAIRALEGVAKNDKNREGPYICVFGIAMEKGSRIRKNEAKSKTPYSWNTEVWLSDFFWPFFSNYSYEEIIKNVLEVLISEGNAKDLNWEIPKGLIDSFGEACRKYSLVDEIGNFNDPFRLVNLFCGKLQL
ncbi:MAG: hypothetical protein ABI729_05960 [Chitinophagales bacterium]